MLIEMQMLPSKLRDARALIDAPSMLRPESLHALCAAFQKRPEDVQVDGVAGGLIAPGVAEIGAGIAVPPHQPPHLQRGQLSLTRIVDDVFEMDGIVAI